MEIPKDLYYTKDHEWAKISDDIVTVGITTYAIDQLGDITMVELPEIGKDVSTGESLGVIESVKAVSDLYAPTTGTIIQVNEELEDNPNLINESPYEDGWIVKLQLRGNLNLLDAESYQELIDD